MIIMPRRFYDEIVKRAVEGASEEICGLIGGTLKDGTKEVKEIYFLENTDHSKEHFSMNPKEQLEAVKDMRKKGIIPLGNFHSHPESPARPSEEDKRLAYDKEASYMIISLADRDRIVLKSFRITGNASSEEDIKII